MNINFNEINCSKEDINIYIFPLCIIQLGVINGNLNPEFFKSMKLRKVYECIGLLKDNQSEQILFSQSALIFTNSLFLRHVLDIWTKMY